MRGNIINVHREKSEGKRCNHTMINIDIEIPEFESGDDGKAEKFFSKEARILEKALSDALPHGTLVHLMARLIKKELLT